VYALYVLRIILQCILKNVFVQVRPHKAHNKIIKENRFVLYATNRLGIYQLSLQYHMLSNQTTSWNFSIQNTRTSERSPPFSSKSRGE